MKQAIIYGRVSSREQTKGFSLESQEEEARKWAADLGLEIVGQYQDGGKTGQDLDRSGIQEVLARLRRGDADTLLIHAHDRLSRDEADGMVIEKELRKLGVRIGIVKDRRWFGSTTLERIPDRFAQMFSQVEIENLSERSNRGRQRKIRSGIYNGTMAPYGYDRVGEKRDATLVINPVEAEVVRHIFDWYCFGLDGTPLSVQKIAERLTAFGYPKPSETKGIKYHAKKASQDGFTYDKWAAPTLYKILRNDTYHGVFYHNRLKLEEKKDVPRPREEWIGVPVPAIIPKDLFDLAQTRLDEGKKKVSNDKAKYPYLLRGRVRCVCGNLLIASTSYDVRPDGSHTEKYLYYACRLYQRSQENNCRLKLKGRQLDPFIWNWFAETMAHPDNVVLRLRKRQTEVEEDNATFHRRIELLRERIKEEKDKISRYNRLFGSGRIEDDEYDQLTEEPKRVIKVLEEDLERVEAQVANPITEEAIQSVRAAAEMTREKLLDVELAEDEDAAFAARRKLMELYDVKVRVVEALPKGWRLEVESHFTVGGPESLVLESTVSVHRKEEYQSNIIYFTERLLLVAA